MVDHRAISTIAIITSNEDRPHITIEVNGARTEALVDTGSRVTAIHPDFLQRIQNNLAKTGRRLKNNSRTPIRIQAAFGKVQIINEEYILPLKINGTLRPWRTLILPSLISDCILGQDFLVNHEGQINCSTSEVELGRAREDYQEDEIFSYIETLDNRKHQNDPSRNRRPENHPNKEKKKRNPAIPKDGISTRSQ